MPIRIAIAQPIAGDLYGTTAVLAETFPAGFVSFDTVIFHRANYLQITECLPGEVNFQIVTPAAAGSCFAGAEAVGIDGYGVAALAAANPLCLGRSTIEISL